MINTSYRKMPVCLKRRWLKSFKETLEIHAHSWHTYACPSQVWHPFKNRFAWDRLPETTGTLHVECVCVRLQKKRSQMFLWSHKAIDSSVKIYSDSSSLKHRVGHFLLILNVCIVLHQSITLQAQKKGTSRAHSTLHEHRSEFKADTCDTLRSRSFHRHSQSKATRP